TSDVPGPLFVSLSVTGVTPPAPFRVVPKSKVIFASLEGPTAPASTLSMVQIFVTPKIPIGMVMARGAGAEEVGAEPTAHMLLDAPDDVNPSLIIENVMPYFESVMVEPTGVGAMVLYPAKGVGATPLSTAPENSVVS